MTEAEFLSRFHHLRTVPREQDYPLRQAGKPAAVLIPLVQHDDGLRVLLTRRAAHLKHHPNQVSFPGGRQEEGDADAVEAALRETHEEIGISRDQITVLGKMPNYRTISGYEIVPVVGLVKANLPLTLDPNEVAEAFEVKLAHVLDRDNHFIHWVDRQQSRYPIYFIPANNTYIWGATAAILRNLSNHVFDH
ncbi:CoA pyrophosphatase [Alteromonas oceanisediminis]|uniref:CoA pyrophosphatase n=1 Tax=Alteromonas oceanisediminis TaxID=2836180 RepID=UPI001BD99EAB|nr:CoA pyrophosphatase [Alteromonas oceanisediminis]MBT0587161.1 CoA pyrophosphatase [Alteromonas oceanisediminis]